MIRFISYNTLTKNCSTRIQTTMELFFFFLFLSPKIIIPPSVLSIAFPDSRTDSYSVVEVCRVFKSTTLVLWRCVVVADPCRLNHHHRGENPRWPLRGKKLSRYISEKSRAMCRSVCAVPAAVALITQQPLGRWQQSWGWQMSSQLVGVGVGGAARQGEEGRNWVGVGGWR